MLNQEKTQGQIAELWADNLTQQNVSYACGKLGITRKKKLTAIKRETQKNGKPSAHNLELTVRSFEIELEKAEGFNQGF